MVRYSYMELGQGGRIMTETLEQYVSDTIDELRDWMKDNPDEEPHDTITELADCNTPIYTQTILDIAASNWEIGTVESEIGPAFDGTATPVNIAAANIYEHINMKLHEWANGLSICDTCDGDRTIDETCYGCGGTGEIEIDDGTAHMEQCAQCRGDMIETLECPDCEGWGKAE